MGGNAEAMVLVEAQLDVGLPSYAVGRASPLPCLDDDDVNRYPLLYQRLHKFVNLKLWTVEPEGNLASLLGYYLEAEVCPERKVIPVANPAEHDLHIMVCADFRIIGMLLQECLYGLRLGDFLDEPVLHHPLRHKLNGDGEVWYLQPDPVGQAFARHGIVVRTKPLLASLVLRKDAIYLLVYSHCQGI